MKISTLLAFAFSLFIYQGASAQEYEVYGVRTLANLSMGPALKRYSVAVKNCANDLSHVKLRVSDNGVSVQGGGIGYTDGSKDEYSFSKTYQAGYESSWLSLDMFRTPGRCISSVFVNAQSIDPRTAHVEVFGNFN